MSRLLIFFTMLMISILPGQSSASGLFHSMEDKIVDFVYDTIDTAKYTAYKLGGSRFDTRKGVYILDCSSYVGQILRNVSPRAFLNLVRNTGTPSPNTTHYYDFFSTLPSDNPYWDKVEDIEELRPGDIIVFRYKKHRHARTRGHIMMVMDKPILTDNGYNVRITDAAPVRHSDDTRGKHRSGIGVGTVRLQANPKTGQPAAYAWQEGSRWKKNVRFAMARPIKA